MTKILPEQFYATKLTLLGLTLIHLASVITFCLLVNNFFNESDLSKAYSEEQVEKTWPAIMWANSFGCMADLFGLIALFTWKFIFSFIFSLMLLVSTVSFHFWSLNDPPVPPLAKMHYIIMTLGGTMFILSVYYMWMQCQASVMKKGKHKGSSPEASVTQQLTVETKGMSCVKQVLVACTLLHFIWSILYLIHHIKHLTNIQSSQGQINNADIDLQQTLSNYVLYRACIAESVLVTAAILLGNVVNLFGVLQHRVVLVVTFIVILFFSSLYTFEGSHLLHWINLAFSLPLLALELFFLMLLIQPPPEVVVQWGNEPSTQLDSSTNQTMTTDYEVS